MDWDFLVAKWVHQGKVWRANETTATALVIAVPTGTAAWSLWNGEPQGGKYYVVLAAYGVQAANGAALNSWGLVHQVSSLAQGTVAPTADLVTSTVVVNLKGNQGIYGGAAVIDLALAVADSRWAPIGQSVNTVVVSLSGTQVYERLSPFKMLPPGAVYSLEGVASATGITAALGNVWAEVEPEELEELGLI